MDELLGASRGSLDKSGIPAGGVPGRFLGVFEPYLTGAHEEEVDG
jgi:hypothetical protein